MLVVATTCAVDDGSFDDVSFDDDESSDPHAARRRALAALTATIA
jgi:hypothetical protein